MKLTLMDKAEAQERQRGFRCCGPGTETSLSRQQVERLSDDLQILANPIRLQILDILAHNEGQVCVCDIEAAVPVKQPTVSHHLKLLRDAGLIDCERHGLWAYYYIRRDTLDAARKRISEQLQFLG